MATHWSRSVKDHAVLNVSIMHRYIPENAAIYCDELSRFWTMIQNWTFCAAHNPSGAFAVRMESATASSAIVWLTILVDAKV